MLYLAACLSSPPLILAGGAGLPEEGGGGFAHLDPKLIGGWVETKRAQIGVSVPFYVPSGRSKDLFPFVSALLRVR